MRTWFTVLIILLLAGCNRGGNILLVKPITGPDSLFKGETGQYSVEASNDTGITCTWAVAPATAGSFSDQGSSSVLFAAADIDSDLTVTIRVVVNSDRDGPVVREKEVLILYAPPEEPEPDENHSPTAGAHTWLTRLTPGSDVQFYNDSNDPDPDDVVTKHEWDFSYDPDDGFNTESEEVSPSSAFLSDGEFSVQLRVTDSGGLTDLLDEPLLITVVSDVGWAISFGGSDTDNGIGLDTDSFGDIYICGSASGDIDFDPGSGVYTHDGHPAFLSKLDPSGEFIWAGSWGRDNPLERSIAYDLAVNPSNQIVVVGKFSEVADFDIGPGEFIVNVSDHDECSFISAYDRGGNFLWVEPGTENFNELHYANSPGKGYFISSNYMVTEIDFDDSGCAYTYRNDIEKEYYVDDYGALFLLNTYSFEYLYKARQDGLIDWSRKVSLGAFRNEEGRLAPTDNGFCYMLWFGKNESFCYDDRLYLYNTDGETEWVLDDDSICRLVDISSDNADNCFIVGEYPENDTYSCFVRKYSFDGNLLWEGNFGKHDSDNVCSVAVGFNQCVYITGYFKGLVDFDPGEDSYEVEAVGDYDYYLLKLTPCGEFQWVRTWDGPPEWTYNPYNVEISVDPLGDILILGRFRDTVDLKPGPEQQFFTSTGESDIYLIKFAPDGNW